MPALSRNCIAIISGIPRAVAEPDFAWSKKRPPFASKGRRTPVTWQPGWQHVGTGGETNESRGSARSLPGIIPLQSGAGFLFVVTTTM
jgi:hypothetical protein